MKKLLRKIGLSLATLACALCAGVGITLGVSETTTAKADEIAESDFWISSTGIRLVNDADGTGIRFHTNITTENYDLIKESGALIIPEYRYDGELTLDDLNNTGKNVPVHMDTTGSWYDYEYVEDGETLNVMRSTVYLYDIPATMYGARMVAVSYVTTEDGVTTYAEIPQQTSIADIANKVLEIESFEKYYEQATPYAIETVTVTYVTENGESTETVGYGTTLKNVPDYTDNSAFTGWEDQYGRTLDLTTYEVTLPLTLTATFSDDTTVGGTDSAEFEHGIPDNAVMIRPYTWADDGVINHTAESTTEPAPAGFNNVIQYNWSSTGENFPFNTYMPTDDLSGYSDVYFAIKMTGGNGIFLRNQSSNYTGGDWLYAHFHQEKTKLWSLSIKSADGTYDIVNVHTGLDGYTRTENTDKTWTITGTYPTLRGLVQYCGALSTSNVEGSGFYPTKEEKDTTPIVYYTEVLGVSAETGERVIYSAVDGAAISTDEIGLSAGHTTLFKKSNFAMSDFASLDISNATYDTITFAMLGNQDFVFNTGYKYQIEGTEHPTSIYSRIGGGNDTSHAYTVQLTNNGDSNWTVRIYAKRYVYISSGNAKYIDVNEPFTADVTGNSLEEIMSTILSVDNSNGGMTLYVSEVRGVHGCEYTKIVDNGDGTHSYTCTICGKVGSTESHTGGTASCIALAQCTICNASYGDYGKCVVGTAATCTTAAICGVCGKDIGKPLGHTGGTATCSALAVCTLCNEEYGELKPHDTSKLSISYGDASCGDCGQVVADAVILADAVFDVDNSSGWITEDTSDADKPDGFDKVTKFNTTSSWPKSGLLDKAESTIAISLYKEMWFALKVSGVKIAFGEGKDTDKNNIMSFYTDADWMYFHATQTGSGVWTIKLTTGGTTAYKTFENQAATTLSALLYDGGWDSSDKGTIMIYKETESSTTASLYSTEIRGYSSDIPNRNDVVNVGSLWQGSDEVKVSSETAPLWFTSTTEFEWTGKENTNGDFPYQAQLTTLDISQYSDLWFAMKITNGLDIIVQGSPHSYYNNDVWVYVHLQQGSDGTWSKNFYAEDGSLCTIGMQTGLSGTTLQSLIAWGSGTNYSGSFPRSGAGKTATAYFTNLIGIKK